MVPVLPVTAALAGFFGVLMSILSFRMGTTRFNSGVFYGPVQGKTADETKQYEYRQRAHQNMTEYVPIFLFVLACLEINKVLSGRALAAYAIVFAVARVSHSVHLAAPRSYPPILRIAGFVTQILLTTGGGITLLMSSVKALRA